MLAQALDSVLNQSVKNLEVIVIDDCSSDGTEDFMKTLTDERVKYFRNEKNNGPEPNRNFALNNSHGKYIVFLDDDDYYTDYDFFSKALKIFEEHNNETPELSFVCANAQTLDLKTGELENSYIGKPGRVKGLDFILKNKEYRKPTSLFPTVFKLTH